MSDKNQRFVKGKLVMLSRKNTKSGDIPYFKKAEVDKMPAQTNRTNRYYGTLSTNLRLQRGIPIFLSADPEFLPFKDLPPLPYYFFGRNKDKNFWKVTFLLEEQLYVMFLSNRQYNHELVKAVPRRLSKDYTSASSKPQP